MPKRVAINGFGRIGRAAFKIALAQKGVQVVAINDLTDPKTLAYLLKYDSVYGRYDQPVSFDDKNLIVAGRKYPILAEKNPSALPWQKLRIDVVLECTGVFTRRAELEAHLRAGAKKVVLSAPAKDDVQTLVFGTALTTKELAKKDKKIVSNASCTTNCVAPVMQALELAFGVEKAIMTTIHAYTASQKIVDGPDAKDLRRGRAGAINISPSTTGAATAATLVVPALKGKFDGLAVRVPVPCGSLSDITAVLKRNVSAGEINHALAEASKEKMFKGILRVTAKDEEPVSTDVIGTTYSCIVDAAYTKVVGGNLVKILAWYDNEWAYASRLVDMALSL